MTKNITEKKKSIILHSKFRRHKIENMILESVAETKEASFNSRNEADDAVTQRLHGRIHQRQKKKKKKKKEFNRLVMISRFNLNWEDA